MQTIEQRLEQLDKLLDEYEQHKGVSFVGEDEVTVEARQLQNLLPTALKKFSAVQCGEAAYCLRQFSFRLQVAYNREQGRVKWCEESVIAIIGPTLHQYRGYSYDERKHQALIDNEAAKKFEAIRVQAQLRMERLSYLASKVGDMAKSLESLQFSKRGEKE